MKKNVDLLEGPIAGTLVKLAFPIMGTSFIQMAYNLVDMIWIGRISSNAVASVGAAGMFMWMANGIITIPKMGGQVTVAQALGSMKKEKAVDYARGAVRMGILMGILYGLISILFSDSLIGFFKLNSESVIRDARMYLTITCGAVIFSFLNQIITGILAAMGNTITTFRSTTIGLVLNLILDPVFIFGLGPVPRMEVTGAALATVFAQIIVFLIFLGSVWNEPVIFRDIHLTQKAEKEHVKEIFKIGFPSAIQDALFSGISMIVARLIAGWGDAAVAVQKVGSQIESISWLTAGGFSTAVNAFVAQNYGAGKQDRIRKGYKTAMGIMALWGVFTSVILLIFPEFFVQIFITEKEVVSLGADYLMIMSISEFFMCMEITTSGAFQGFGRTIPPSITGILFNAMRIPLAMILSSTGLGLNGIWWTITISCICKGTFLPVWYFIEFMRDKKPAKTCTDY